MYKYIFIRYLHDYVSVVLIANYIFSPTVSMRILDAALYTSASQSGMASETGVIYRILNTAETSYFIDHHIFLHKMAIERFIGSC